MGLFLSSLSSLKHRTDILTSVRWEPIGAEAGNGHHEDRHPRFPPLPFSGGAEQGPVGMQGP